MTVPDSKPLLILDLDETLIYATESSLHRDPDFRVGQYYVYRRPGLQAFLSHCAERFLLAVWTSSSPPYAARVVANIKPIGLDFQFVWARDRCTRRMDMETLEHEWLKDLKKVKRRGFALERVLVVDDTAEKLVRSYGNLIRVEPYLGSLDDQELPALSVYLDRIRDEPDYRRIEKRGWRVGLDAGL